MRGSCLHDLHVFSYNIRIRCLQTSPPLQMHMLLASCNWQCSPLHCTASLRALGSLGAGGLLVKAKNDGNHAMTMGKSSRYRNTTMLLSNVFMHVHSW